VRNSVNLSIQKYSIAEKQADVTNMPRTHQLNI